MKKPQPRHCQLFHREEGAEVTELAIVLGLIVAGTIVVISLVGGSVQQLFSYANGLIP